MNKKLYCRFCNECVEVDEGLYCCNKKQVLMSLRQIKSSGCFRFNESETDAITYKKIGEKNDQV